MRIHVLGGGPAGLYFAYLMKCSGPGHEIVVFEQNAPDVTYGFGVVLSGRAWDGLAAVDSSLVTKLSEQIEAWGDQHIVVNVSASSWMEVRSAA
jgi:anthraniloyl-CoA monooxygenase